MKTVKKKKVSKKNKSSWRKHVDISDVDGFLESSRLEERIGTVEDVPDSELFQVDKTPSKKSQNASVKSKRRAIASRPLKCLSGLENASKVTDPLKNRTKVKNCKNAMRLKHPSAKKGKSSKLEEKKQDFAEDLWNDVKSSAEAGKTDTGLDSEWFSEKLVEHHLRDTGKAPFKVPNTARQVTSKLKAFESPHPGTSYNPRKDDHRQLLNDVIKNEETLMKKDAHLDRVTTKMFSKVAPEERDRQLLQEMSAGLGFDVEIKQEDEIKKEFPEEDTVGSINPPVERKPKSKKAQKKKAEEIKRRELVKKSKIEKKKISDIVRIGQLKQSIVKKEMKLANRRNKEDKEEAEKAFKPRRLGHRAFKEPDVDVAYPEEVTGNLRTTKNQGSVLKDRYVSLGRRNMLAPSKRQGVRRRHKVKRYVRNTHKCAMEKPINTYQPGKKK
ncbi:ribosome biogenesis protein NOP53 [Phlebotomus argentipes]|uniref:ribosome biogenesis protein NOP53 n=1 Tax=Phlebotomus argentipes TaxID=94469 RepID=UPI0028931532|nr:ribosome biogenesis protein NOP53 [Phlebotomus argentipes]